MQTEQTIESRIMIALDYAKADDAKRLLAELAGIQCYMKVGMQLFYAAGPDFVRSLKEQGYKVFLDLKLHDIPNTVRGAADSITRLGVDMFNVHAGGGMQMMQAALEGVHQAAADRPGAPLPLVIGVTQLTSTSEYVLNEEIGIPGPIENAVLRYAAHAKRAGLHGVVASPLEVPSVKRHLGDSFIAVTPGIRPAGSEAGDQSRITTPGDAFQLGSDYIVIGRPITAAPNPRQALESIITSIKEMI